MYFAATVFCLLIAGNYAHKYKTGECPAVEPLTDFNMKQVCVFVLVYGVTFSSILFGMSVI